MTSLLNNSQLSQKASHFFILISSCLLYLSFPNVFSLAGYPFCAYLFAVFLFGALKKKSLSQRFFIGIASGLVSYLLIVSWVFPVDWKGYCLFACGLAIQPLLFCVLYKEDFSFAWVNVLYAPCLWVATEYARSNLLGGFAWTIGYSQSFISPVIQIMDLTGAYGVSFFIILINGCLYHFLQGPKNRLLSLGVMLLGIGMVVVYAYKQSLDSSSLSISQQAEICVIQPNISPQEKLNPEKLQECLDKQIKMCYACLAKGNPDLIIWPEAAVPDDFTKRQGIFQQVTTLAREINTPLLLGSAMLIKGNDYNSVALINQAGTKIPLYHKRRLIPFAEYYPFQKEKFFKKFFYANKFDFKAGKQAGNFEMPVKEARGKKTIPFGVLICSEEFYPQLLRDLGKKEPRFIASLLNDGWFKRKEALMMHLQAAITQAVSFRIPVVRASNTGVSAFINEQGEVTRARCFLEEKGWQLNQKKVFLFNVSCKKMKSFYSQYGDIFSLICLLFVLIINANSYIAKNNDYDPT